MTDLFEYDDLDPEIAHIPKEHVDQLVTFLAKRFAANMRDLMDHRTVIAAFLCGLANGYDEDEDYFEIDSEAPPNILGAMKDGVHMGNIYRERFKWFQQEADKEGLTYDGVVGLFRGLAFTMAANVSQELIDRNDVSPDQIPDDIKELLRIVHDGGSYADIEQEKRKMIDEMEDE